MKVRKILIELRNEEKIYKKHGIRRVEIEGTLLGGNPLYYKIKDKRYFAFAKVDRYITIVFSCKKDIANIITAYPSSSWQIRLYKKKRSGK